MRTPNWDGAQPHVMLGTERTGKYKTVAVTPLGRVGVRDLGNGQHRIRVEPRLESQAPEFADELHKDEGWKQYGQDGQPRFSKVVNSADLAANCREGLECVGAVIASTQLDVNPDAPAHLKALMVCPDVVCP